MTVQDNDSTAFTPTAEISLPSNGQTVSGTNADFFGQGKPGGTRVLAINGGGAVAGAYAADKLFSGGTVGSGTTANVDTSQVVNPAPLTVYQSARVGNFTYTLSGLAASQKHTVRLHFNEYYFSAAGKRSFNVTVNGSAVLNNFDVFASAGGQNKAILREVTTTADDAGKITVVFTSVVNNGLLSGLEVFRGGATVVKANFFVDDVLKSTDSREQPPGPLSLQPRPQRLGHHRALQRLAYVEDEGDRQRRRHRQPADHGEGRELTGPGYRKFCTDHTLPAAVMPKPQTTFVYLVLDMFR